MSKASMDYGKANQAINDGHYGKFMNAINDIEDINEVDHNKNSLGHWIVAYKRIDWVDELTKKKFDWSVKNGQNMTPLELAQNAIKNHDSSFIDIKNKIANLK